MKYVQIVKLPYPDGENKYVLLRRNLNGTMSKACEMDRFPTYLKALYWAYRWHKMMQRNARLGCDNVEKL